MRVDSDQVIPVAGRKTVRDIFWVLVKGAGPVDEIVECQGACRSNAIRAQVGDEKIKK